MGTQLTLPTEMGTAAPHFSAHFALARSPILVNAEVLFLCHIGPGTGVLLPQMSVIYSLYVHCQLFGGTCETTSNSEAEISGLSSCLGFNGQIICSTALLSEYHMISSG